MLKKISETLKKNKNEDGFSLIDVVVTVAIVVALSVGGFIAYNGIVGNAQQAAVDGAADQVYTAAMVKYNSGGATDMLEREVGEVVSAYKGDDTSGIQVSVEFKDSDGDGVNDSFTITATDAAHGKSATRGPSD